MIDLQKDIDAIKRFEETKLRYRHNFGMGERLATMAAQAEISENGALLQRCLDEQIRKNKEQMKPDFADIGGNGYV